MVSEVLIMVYSVDVVLGYFSFVVPAAYDDGWSMNWLYSGVGELWTPWLPTDTHPDIHRGGFFSFSPMPGLRVVSINMNYCNKFNWYESMKGRISCCG